ncbi:MAG: DUF4240 domain-containing protein [Saprospiraceae bacterium]
MTVHKKIKLKDLDEKFIQGLKDEFKDEEIELEIRVNISHGEYSEEQMDEDLFWKIIGKFDWEKEGDDQAVMEPAITFLSHCSINSIKIFHNILSEKLYMLDGEQFARNTGSNAYTKDGHFSVDLFLYARCCVIANGREYYEYILQHPEEMPKDLTFEAILNLPAIAFELKTGFEMEHVPSHNYETFFNSLGWNKTTPRII